MRGWHTMPYTFLRGAARAFELASSALTHLAAGTLRLQDLRGAIVNAWEEFGRSEELIRSGLMPWERALYDRFLKVEDRILVVGCGTGRDLIALLKLGYRVEGLDVGPRAIALARRILEKEGLSTALHTGPIEAVALPGRRARERSQRRRLDGRLPRTARRWDSRVDGLSDEQATLPGSVARGALDGLKILLRNRGMGVKSQRRLVCRFSVAIATEKCEGVPEVDVGVHGSWI